MYYRDHCQLRKVFSLKLRCKVLLYLPSQNQLICQPLHLMLRPWTALRRPLRKASCPQGVAPKEAGTYGCLADGGAKIRASSNTT